MQPRLCRLLLSALLIAPGASAYSVLSHEAIIDAAWDGSLKPILLARFPHSSPDDLRKAHGYAYGGAIIQDMGYYPFGSHLFSDLVHYVRSGDFIVNMLSQAQDLDEYAFALGALAHYSADDEGHAIAVNLAVPLLYPKVRKKFGRVATYEDDPTDHLRMEFAFDVSQVAANHYAPSAYHDFIGFGVSKELLERAFLATYGIPLTDVSKTIDLALGTYRRTVSSIIPEMTKVAWDAKKKELIRDNPGISKRQFVYAIRRSSYEKEWGTNYQKPGLGTRFLTFLLAIVPKVGPFRALSFKPATPETQKLFMDSFVKALDAYKQTLAQIGQGTVPALADTNFDTGKTSAYGTYHLADDACGKLVVKLSDKLSAKDSPGIDGALRESILKYYGDKSPQDPKVAWALTAIRNAPSASSPAH
jgi:hypothetical protein